MSTVSTTFAFGTKGKFAHHCKHCERPVWRDAATGILTDFVANGGGIHACRKVVVVESIVVKD